MPWPCDFFLEGVAAQSSDNNAKARAIRDLYESLKGKVIELTHSQFAIPLMDFMFERPIFRGSDLSKLTPMPSVPMISNMLNKLKSAGILHTVRAASGRRSQVLAVVGLINLCEGRKVL